MRQSQLISLVVICLLSCYVMVRIGVTAALAEIGTFIYLLIKDICTTVQWRRNVSQWDGSSRPTFKSGTARNAFFRPTFWPQTAYCTYNYK